MHRKAAGGTSSGDIRSRVSDKFIMFPNETFRGDAIWGFSSVSNGLKTTNWKPNRPDRQFRQVDQFLVHSNVQRFELNQESSIIKIIFNCGIIEVKWSLHDGN